MQQPTQRRLQLDLAQEVKMPNLKDMTTASFACAKDDKIIDLACSDGVDATEGRFAAITLILYCTVKVTASELRTPGLAYQC